MGRLSSVTVNAVNGAAHGTGNDTNLTTSYTYDDLGRKTQSTDPAGTHTQLGYARLGNLISGTLDSGTGRLNLAACAAYDAAGELIAF